MAMTKLKLALGTVVVAGVATSLVIQHSAQNRLLKENDSLRQQITHLQSDNASLAQREAVAKLKLRLPAPPMRPGFRAALDPGLPPDARRQWLDVFEKSAPNNGLANYLSTNNYFNSGQTDKAVQELINVSGKPQLSNSERRGVEGLESTSFLIFVLTLAGFWACKPGR